MGVRLFPFCQDLGQLRQLYRQDGAETFLANADAQIFFGNSDMATLNYVSNRLGTITDDELVIEPPRLKSYRRAHRRSFESVEETMSRLEVENRMESDWHQYKMARIGRPRRASDDVERLVGKRPGEKVAASMIVFGPRGHVYNLRLAPYFLPAPETAWEPEPEAGEAYLQMLAWLPALLVLIVALYVGASLLNGTAPSYRVGVSELDDQPGAQPDKDAIATADAEGRRRGVTPGRKKREAEASRKARQYSLGNRMVLPVK